MRLRYFYLSEIDIWTFIIGTVFDLSILTTFPDKKTPEFAKFQGDFKAESL